MLIYYNIRYHLYYIFSITSLEYIVAMRIAIAFREVQKLACKVKSLTVSVKDV